MFLPVALMLAVLEACRLSISGQIANEDEGEGVVLDNTRPSCRWGYLGEGAASRGKRMNLI